jgi:hypothetical protein
MASTGGIFRERRRYERYDISLPLEAVFVSGGAERVIRSRSVNICAGGAYFPSTVDFGPGTHLGLQIEAPSGSLPSLLSGGPFTHGSQILIKTKCEVVRSEACPGASGEFGLGVVFDGPMRISPAPRRNAEYKNVDKASFKEIEPEKTTPPGGATGRRFEVRREGGGEEPGLNPVSPILTHPSVSVLHTGKQEDRKHG